MRVVLGILAALLACTASLVWSSAAHAQKRIALLIGNQGYNANVGSLRNPHNDIELMAGALKQVGFEVLPLVKDARRSAMLGAVRGLVARLNAVGAGSIGFLYYSGHGAAESATGVNYLIPIDATSADTAEFWDQSLKLDDVLRLLDNATQAAHFVVFDACRNELRLTEKSTSKGFIPVSEQAGMFIAYAAAPGRPASDVGAKSGPYAAALATELVKTGQHHLDLFQNVKEAVANASAGKQEPWERNGLRRRVYFGGTDVAKPVATTAPSPVQSQTSEAERIWATVKDTSNQSVLEAFIQHYGNTFFGALARARLDELRKQQVAVAVPPKASVLPSRCEGVETTVGTERHCLKPKDSFKDCPGCPEMVVVPAGEFTMGSPWDEEDRSKVEGPQRKVSIARPFAVAKFEVTFTEWDACVAAGGCKHKPADEGWGRGRRPVVNVSWDDITSEFLAWLSRKAAKSYRLLTEAEWEYVARAGTTTPFETGRTITIDQANFDGNFTYGGSAKGQFRRRTIDVGSFRPNAFGIHDMHGNAWEWVEDCFGDSYAGAPTDGSAVTSGKCPVRVQRGGSWSGTPVVLRSAARSSSLAYTRMNGNGFRVARTLD